MIPWGRKQATDETPAPSSPAGAKTSRLRDGEERSASGSATLFGPWADHNSRCSCNVCR